MNAVPFASRPDNRLQALILGSVLLLLMSACQPAPTAEPTPEDTATTIPTNTPIPAATPTPTLFVGGSCDPETQRVEMNQRLALQVEGGSYPDTCEVYCLWVPAGSQLEIGISDFSVDLDIYVDVDLSVLAFSDHGRWESNAYGTGDEQVSIMNPEGRYYMQVCSYEGVASGFTLWSRFVP